MNAIIFLMEILPGIITLFFLGCASTDTSRAYCPTPLIEAEEGRDVSLLCHVHPSVDLSAYTVDWKRTDLNKVVFSWRHGQENHDAQMVSYRGRGTIADLSTGNLTLQIFSAQLSDTGPYKCFIPKWKTFCIVQLNVTRERHGRFSTTRPPLDMMLEPAHPVKNILIIGLSIGVIFLLIVVGFLLKKNIKLWKYVGKLKRQK